MAIGTPTLLTSGASGISGGLTSTTLTTAAVTPSTSGVCFVAVSVQMTSGTSTPTISGCGLTWSLVKKQPGYSTTWQLVVWEGRGTPSNGTIVVTASGGDTWDRMVWSVFDFVGANLTTPIVSANTVGGNTQFGATDDTLTYTQAFAPGSAGIGFFGSTSDIATGTPRTLWTEVSDASTGGGQVNLQTQYILSSDTAGQVTWSVSVDRFSCIIELADASVAGSINAQIAQTGQNLFSMNQVNNGNFITIR